jgi:hypothetical protein
MNETLYILSYKTTIGGWRDTEEPEQTMKTTRPDLTTKELNSLLYSLQEGDFGAQFWDIEIKEQEIEEQ